MEIGTTAFGASPMKAIIVIFAILTAFWVLARNAQSYSLNLKAQWKIDSRLRAKRDARKQAIEAKKQQAREVQESFYHRREAVEQAKQNISEDEST